MLCLSHSLIHSQDGIDPGQRGSRMELITDQLELSLTQPKERMPYRGAPAGLLQPERALLLLLPKTNMQWFFAKKLLCYC